ncbi:MAG: methylglutaconyl-CoA hydratase [Patiriisocius sp.]|jgi:methylglutaconyl-CoA hydratase
MKSEGEVKINISDGIAEITFGHPKSNALPSNILRALKDCITSAGENDEIKVILLKSFGDRTFCAGASFDELVAIDNFEVGKEFFMGFARVINAMRKCPKVIVGCVQGKAVGGGVGIASACDYTLATKFASVKLSELAVGIGPFVVGPAVARKIGMSSMSQLAINATEWKTANWAREKGLYAEIYESMDDMMSAANKLASTLSKSNPEALEGIKKISWVGAESWDDLLEKRAEVSGKLVLSDFTRNAIKSFKKTT